MARLTDQEQQEIIRFIESDKALPDKYRFLLFQDKREVELVWNGKTNDICSTVLPFQTIEQVDEPRSEKPEDTPIQSNLFATDARGRQLKGWTNKLIWGDNKLILSSLKNGPLREEIDAALPYSPIFFVFRVLPLLFGFHNDDTERLEGLAVVCRLREAGPTGWIAPRPTPVGTAPRRSQWRTRVG